MITSKHKMCVRVDNSLGDILASVTVKMFGWQRNGSGHIKQMSKPLL